MSKLVRKLSVEGRTPTRLSSGLGSGSGFFAFFQRLVALFLRVGKGGDSGGEDRVLGVLVLALAPSGALILFRNLFMVRLNTLVVEIVRRFRGLLLEAIAQRVSVQG